MDVLLEMVSFSGCDSEERLKGIVREMIDNGEVPEYDGFFNESQAKKARRHRKWEKERKETEKLDSMLLLSLLMLIYLKCFCLVAAIEKEMMAGKKKRAEEFGLFISNLEQKYAKKPKVRKSIASGSEKKTVKSRKK